MDPSTLQRAIDAALSEAISITLALAFATLCIIVGAGLVVWIAVSFLPIT